LPREAVFFGPEGPDTQNVLLKKRSTKAPKDQCPERRFFFWSRKTNPKRLHETVPRNGKPLKVPRKATPHLGGAGFVCISARDHKGLSETHVGT